MQGTELLTLTLQFKQQGTAYLSFIYWPLPVSMSYFQQASWFFDLLFTADCVWLCDYFICIGPRSVMAAVSGPLSFFDSRTVVRRL